VYTRRITGHLEVRCISLDVSYQLLPCRTPGSNRSSDFIPNVLDILGRRVRPLHTPFTPKPALSKLHSFPGLARSTDTLREAARAYKAGAISRTDFELADSMKRNEISNMSFAVGSAGSLAVIAVGIGIFNALHVNASVQNNNWGFRYSTPLAQLQSSPSLYRGSSSRSAGPGYPAREHEHHSSRDMAAL